MEYQPPKSRNIQARPRSSIGTRKPRLPTRPQTAHDMRRKQQKPNVGGRRNNGNNNNYNTRRPNSSYNPRNGKYNNNNKSRWNRIRESHSRPSSSRVQC